MIVRECTKCGQKNRIPAEHLADRGGKCGKCATAIEPLDKPLEVNDEMFDEIRTKAKVPVLVDFWAEWCGPCRMAAPEVEKAAKQAAGQAIVLKVNTEQQQALAARYNVQGIPNFIVLRAGDVVLQKPGMVKADQLLAYLSTASAAA